MFSSVATDFGSWTNFPVPQKTIDPKTNMNFDQQTQGQRLSLPLTVHSSHTAIRTFSRDKDDLVYGR